MENKKQSNVILIIVLLIAIVAVIILAFINYKLLDSKSQLQNEIDALKYQIQNIQSAPKTEKEEIEAVVKEYLSAVNTKDWVVVQKYSDANIVKILKDYGITNMVISNYSDYEYLNDSYCYSVSFDYNTNKAESLKDVGIGKILTVKKENTKFTINPICTTP